MTLSCAGFLKRAGRTLSSRPEGAAGTDGGHTTGARTPVDLRDQALVIDTSLLRPAQLLSQIKELMGHRDRGLTLVFESFAFKRGIPMDADYVFDVRMLPNPHYERALRP